MSESIKHEKLKNLIMKPVVAHIKGSYLPLTQTFIHDIISNLRQFRPIILTKEIENLDLFPVKEVYSISQLKRYSWWWFWNSLGNKYLNRKDIYFEYILRRSRTKLLHAHFGPNGFELLQLKKRLRLPLITTFYGADMSFLPRQKEWREAYTELFDKGDLFLVEGTHMKKALANLGCQENKIRIQNIGADIKKIEFKERTLQNRAEKVKILFCGRFIEKKGLIYALRAIKLVSSSHPNIEFRIIGDGELRPEIEDFVKRGRLGPYTIMLGYQSHARVIEEMYNAHILLQPSVTGSNGDTEGGAPTILLEAQANGLPVVSTLHADIPEIVLDKKSGFLVPERDEEALAEKLTYLITHSELWPELGKNGRRYVEENHNIYNEVRKLENIYLQLCQ